jgi:hypothetical protein
MTRTVICMKWGTRYGAEFANRLHSMVRRHTTGPLRFVCFTDDRAGLDPGIEAQPLPPIDLPERVAWSPWRKLSLWQHPLSDLEGEALFLDLDIVVTGSLDDLFTFAPGAYCVIHNWTQPRRTVGNTSVFRFAIGKHTHIFDKVAADPEAVLARYRIEQQYISAEIEGQVFWPRPWCASFKHTCVPRWPLNFALIPRLPRDARVVVFSGHPDPDEALVGRYPVKAGWKRLYKHIRPTPWIAEHWR